MVMIALMAMMLEERICAEIFHSLEGKDLAFLKPRFPNIE